MRLHDGRYECSYCRELLDIPRNLTPEIRVRARSGEPNIHSVEIEGRVIHQCLITPLNSRTLDRQRNRTSSVDHLAGPVV
jgi:hypothetical protein